MASQVKNGKAFEYACLHQLYEVLHNDGVKVVVVEDSSYKLGSEYLSEKSPRSQKNYLAAAKAGIDALIPLEPRLLHVKKDEPLSLFLMPDSVAEGPDGDVRDVLCLRAAEGWEVGISCKHNHEALRHPRVTKNYDFAQRWLGKQYHVSALFIGRMKVLEEELEQYHGMQWDDIFDKEGKFYIPILEAYKDELLNQSQLIPEFAEYLLRYFIGSKDFYKLIMETGTKTTSVTAFNLNGTLGQPIEHFKSLGAIRTLKWPKSIREVRFIDGDEGIDLRSRTTIVVTFDAGWSVKMRIHNKDKHVRSLTNLAWDIQLEGLPPHMRQETRSW